MNAYDPNARMPRAAVSRLAVAVGLMLLVPLVAMRLTSEVDWSTGDFVVAGALLFGAGFAFLLAATKLRSRAHRIAAGIALLVALAWAWVELAVGLFTDWGS